MKLKGFCGGSYVSLSPLADNEKTVNWYPTNQESQAAATDWSLDPTPGVDLIGSTFPGGIGRAHFTQNDREFVVIGPTFAEVDAAGVITGRGAVTVDGNPATISSNGKAGNQLLITSGKKAYIFTLSTNAFVGIAALDGLATMGDQLDGYFLVLDADTSTWYFSALLDGLTWNTGLNFIKRSAASDSWVALKVVNKYIWLLGSETSEIWYDAGTFPTPFAPYPTTLIPYGCTAPFSPVVANGAVIWLGSSKSGKNFVLKAPGFSPSVISTYALSVELASFTVTSDAVGDAYTSLGHTFYLLSFPTQQATICYDDNTQLWHDRGTWIAELSLYTDWRPRFHAFAFGEHRMLDSQAPFIYRMDETIKTDVEERPIRRMRRSPTLGNENQRIFVSAFELDMEIGLGNTIPPGDDPQVMARVSYDGGKSWGSEVWRSAGKIGEYSRRVIWNRQGAGRRRCWEIVVSDGVPWRLLGANLEIRDAPKGLNRAQQQAQG